MARRWSSAGLQHCVGCGVQRRARCREAPEAFREGFGSLPGRAGRAQAGRRQHNEVPLSKVRGPAVQGSRSRCARFKVRGSAWSNLDLGKVQALDQAARSQAGTPRLGLPGPAVQGASTKANPPRISSLRLAALGHAACPCRRQAVAGAASAGRRGGPAAGGARGGGIRARAGARAGGRDGVAVFSVFVTTWARRGGTCICL